MQVLSLTAISKRPRFITALVHSVKFDRAAMSCRCALHSALGQNKFELHWCFAKYDNSAAVSSCDLSSPRYAAICLWATFQTVLCTDCGRTLAFDFHRTCCAPMCPNLANLYHSEPLRCRCNLGNTAKLAPPFCQARLDEVFSVKAKQTLKLVQLKYQLIQYIAA